MSLKCLDFEKPIAELEEKIEELQSIGSDSEVDITREIEKLKNKSNELTKSIFKNLSAWQITQLARHPLRPHSSDYIKEVFTDFDELAGDRAFSNDKAIIGGLALLEGKPVMIVGQEKGRKTKDKIERNFGMPHPEGYRKALRLFKLAEKFNIPIITFIDTPGAYAGVEAEARGQSEAIARNLYEMSELTVPVISVIIGEGCSGGALGIGVGNKVVILQYAYYATISPEGCATILFKSADKAKEAAEIMGITPQKLLELGIVDEIISEPLGGAHRNLSETSNTLKQYLVKTLNELQTLSKEELQEQRYARFQNFGKM